MNTEITIETGIPVEVRYSKANRWRVAFSKMLPSQSFTVQNERDRNAAIMMAKRLKIAVTSRKIDGGYRIWRL